MASHMNAQRLATQRNALAEMLIDYTLQLFSDKLYDNGLITEKSEPETQKDFVRDDCNDYYDHFLQLHLSSKLDSKCRTMEIWGQTTCYKGNPSGKPESNKTYEIRETLSEALTLRKWLNSEGKFFRTIHFTLGPSDYTYGWFKTAKENAFDLSLYPKFDSDKDIFETILELADGMVYQYEFSEKLDAIMEDSSNALSIFINNTVNDLYNYFISGYEACKMANLQSELLQEIYDNSAALYTTCINESHNTGMNIKGKAVSLLQGATINDPVLMATLQRLLTNNPFLDEALVALKDWDSWSRSAFDIPSKKNDFATYMQDLWSNESSKKYVIRRLLIRAYTSEGINYIQDIDVDGIDEHNLYSGSPSNEQVKEICNHLIPLYAANGITSSSQLYDILTSTSSRTLVNSSLKFEGINGTNLKPSFYYLEEYLKPDYELVSFSEAGLPAPIAYYIAFATNLNIQQYDNLKVIRRADTKENIAVIKGKFFRKQEFPRRAKEESYVGITATYDLEDDAFKSSYPGKPLIMFIDMQDNWIPPAYALRRLISYGWHPFFQLNRLKAYLDALSKGESDE